MLFVGYHFISFTKQKQKASQKSIDKKKHKNYKNNKRKKKKKRNK
jgi:hypothetical protein